MLSLWLSRVQNFSPQLLGVTASSNEEYLVEERVDEALQGPWSPTRPAESRSSQKHSSSQNASQCANAHDNERNSYYLHDLLFMRELAVQ